MNDRKMAEIRILGRGLLQGPCGTSHPEAVAVAGTFGSWAKGKPIARGKGIPFTFLLEQRFEKCDPLTLNIETCVRVKVNRVGRG